MDSYLTLDAATLALPLPTQVPSYEQCSQLIHIYMYVCMYVCMYMPVNVLPGLSIQLTLSLLLEIATCLVIDGDEASRYSIGCLNYVLAWHCPMGSVGLVTLSG